MKKSLNIWFRFACFAVSALACFVAVVNCSSTGTQAAKKGKGLSAIEQAQLNWWNGLLGQTSLADRYDAKGEDDDDLWTQSYRAFSDPDNNPWVSTRLAQDLLSEVTKVAFMSVNFESMKPVMHDTDVSLLDDTYTHFIHFANRHEKNTDPTAGVPLGEDFTSVEALSSFVQHLQDLGENLSSRENAIVNKIKDLDKCIADSGDVVAIAKAYVRYSNELDQKNQDINTQNQTLLGKLKGATSYDDFKQKLQRLEDSVGTKQNQAESANQSLRDHMDQLSDIEQNIKSKTDAGTIISDNIDSHKKNTGLKEQDLTETKQTLTGIENLISDVESKVENQKTQFDALASDDPNYDAKRIELEGAVADLEGLRSKKNQLLDLNEMFTQQEDVKKEKTALEAQLQNLNTQTQDFQNKQQQADTAAAAAVQELTEYQDVQRDTAGEVQDLLNLKSTIERLGQELGKKLYKDLGISDGKSAQTIIDDTSGSVQTTATAKLFQKKTRAEQKLSEIQATRGFLSQSIYPFIPKRGEDILLAAYALVVYSQEYQGSPIGQSQP